MDNSILYWIWLSQRVRIGPRGQRRLLEQFGSPQALFAAPEAELRRAGLSPALLRTLLDRDLNAARDILERCRALDIRILTLGDRDYPTRLRLLEDAPALLYCRGQLPPEDRPVIGLVGSREADDRGLEAALRLGREIAACGGRVATGMARGIDAQGALGALAQGGQVIGVLGCGVDVVYPKENAALFARVPEQGCLISEYPPGTAPNARNFPVRNRLISALSDAVAVVRAREQSGALITARRAAEQGREVFALPGDPADPGSRGCNALLREGALAAESGWDILRHYEYRYPGAVRMQTAKCKMQNEGTGNVRGGVPDAPQASSRCRAGENAAPDDRRDGTLPSATPKAVLDLSRLSPVQRQIAEALSEGPMQLDALIDRLGLPASQVLTQLTLLQVKKIVIQKPGKLYEL